MGGAWVKLHLPAGLVTASWVLSKDFSSEQSEETRSRYSGELSPSFTADCRAPSSSRGPV